MVTYSSNELIPSSEFAKRFGMYLSQIRDNLVGKLAIIKNNRVEAVVISKDEYENIIRRLRELEKKEFLDSVERGLGDIKNKRVSPIDSLWDKLDD